VSQDEVSLSVSCGNGKLRQWLIDQIDSGKYLGLVWENDEKSIFRIPWKHAGKQDYNRDEDAALFKVDNARQLVEKSQLDISEPYKVYRIIPEGAKRGMKMTSLEESSHLNPISYYPSFPPLPNQMPSYIAERRDWRDFTSSEQQTLPPPPHHHHPHELQYHYPSALSRPWPPTHAENGFQLSFHTYLSESQAPVYAMDPNAITDLSLHVSLFYRESLVKEVTTTSPEGCRISSSSVSSSPSSSPDERLPVGPEVILFPFPYPESHRQGADMLPNVLERGVLLWMTPDGMYAKRLCQSRVYWEGPLAPYVDKPNKLEKEQPCKLFDTQQFLMELQEYIHNGRHPPRLQIVLCFGDEYPDPQRTRKMITAQVEPVFARKLLFYYQQNNGHYLRAYDHSQQPNSSPTSDYTSQRPVQHIQE
uniref:Interferon regulatory factor 4a n=1 Tax=Neogobius melanostomus TaxID=47308 RepID=A0A8C6WZ77_9GOBI